jgi:hypothetical protein
VTVKKCCQDRAKRDPPPEVGVHKSLWVSKGLVEQNPNFALENGCCAVRQRERKLVAELIQLCFKTSR